MLHLEDTLFVCSPLLTFVSSVTSVGGGCTIRWCVGVEDSEVKEGWWFAFVPEILGLDVKSCAFLSIGASEGEALSRQRLESGFDTHVWAYLREKLCSDVSASVVSDGRHGTLWAAESVVNTKRLTTWAVLGSSTTAKSGLSSCLAGPTRGDGTVDVGGVLIANSLAGRRLSSATPGSPLHLPSVVPAMGSVASTKGLGSFDGWGSGWLAGGVTPEAPQAGAPPKFSHLPLWLGVQFVHGTPLRTYEYPTQRPLPLHRQHCGGTLASGTKNLPTVNQLVIVHVRSRKLLY